MRSRETALPSAIAGIPGRDLFQNGKCGSVMLERPGKIALCRDENPDCHMCRRQVTLPVRIIRIGIRKLLSDRERCLIAFLCRDDVAPNLLHVPNVAVVARDG